MLTARATATAPARSSRAARSPRQPPPARRLRCHGDAVSAPTTTASPTGPTRRPADSHEHGHQQPPPDGDAKTVESRRPDQVPVPPGSADEGGSTIVEVLTASTWSSASSSSARRSARRPRSALQATTQIPLDAHQRGRAGLEAMVGELRLGHAPIRPTQPRTRRSAGDGTKSSSTRTPPARTPCRSAASWTYDATPTRSGRTSTSCSPRRATPPAGGPGRPVPAAGAASHRLVLDNVYPRDTGTPIFTYWSYRLSSSPRRRTTRTRRPASSPQLPVPITTTDDAQRDVQVRMAIRVRPAGVTTAANSPLDAILVGAAFARRPIPWPRRTATLFQLPTSTAAGQADLGYRPAGLLLEPPPAARPLTRRARLRARRRRRDQAVDMLFSVRRSRLLQW